jgi:hypothetical protein
MSPASPNGDEKKEINLECAVGPFFFFLNAYISFLLQPLASSRKDLIDLLLASKVLPEFLAFYKTRKFISIYITALHWTLS